MYLDRIVACGLWTWFPHRQASNNALPCRPSERGEDWHSVTSHLSSSSFAWDTQSQGSRQSNASAASSQVRMQAVHSRLIALAQYLSFACMPRQNHGT